jgi:hypothetical protein
LFFKALQDNNLNRKTTKYPGCGFFFTIYLAWYSFGQCTCNSAIWRIFLEGMLSRGMRKLLTHRELYEVDIYGKYILGNYSLLFTDPFFPDYVGLDQNYFNFRNKTTGHCAELGVSFNGTGKTPVSLYAGMIMYGTSVDISPRDSTKVNHSVYLETKYTGNINDYSYNVFIGASLQKSLLYQTKGFYLLNVGVSGQKTLKVSDNFQIPVKLTLSSNPSLEKIFLMLQITI